MTAVVPAHDLIYQILPLKNNDMADNKVKFKRLQLPDSSKHTAALTLCLPISLPKMNEKVEHDKRRESNSVCLMF